MQRIVANNSTYQRPSVQAWFRHYTVFHHHLVAAANSRLTRVERWLRDLTDTPVTRLKCILIVVTTHKEISV